MVVAIDTLKDALAGIGAVVVDQRGVLHDSSAPSPFAKGAHCGLELPRAVKTALMPTGGAASSFARGCTQMRSTTANRPTAPDVKESAASEGSPLPDFTPEYLR